MCILCVCLWVLKSSHFSLCLERSAGSTWLDCSKLFYSNAYISFHLCLCLACIFINYRYKTCPEDCSKDIQERSLPSYSYTFMMLRRRRLQCSSLTSYVYMCVCVQALRKQPHSVLRGKSAVRHKQKWLHFHTYKLKLLP